MELALIADIHANIEALDTVLNDIQDVYPNARIICAGDIVGYGPDPEACIHRLQEHSAICVAGNHDEMVIGKRDFSRCIHAGITAALWTRKNLSRDAWDFLESLPNKVSLTEQVALCHGNLHNADTYVSDPTSAEEAISQLRELWPEKRILICAHTHHAALYSPTSGFVKMAPGTEYSLDLNATSIVNPGAVGQSRDEDPSARYAVLNPERGTIAFRSLAYDHEKTIRKLRRVKLNPQVVMLPPQGIWRRVERLKTRWAQLRANASIYTPVKGER